MPFYAYVLENAADPFHIGHMDDPTRRLGQHNDDWADGAKYAPKNGPWRLVWSEEQATRAAAMARERQIKRMKSSRWIRENLLKAAERVPARRD